jgi:ABC-type amino acid transport substrate-binding protein
LTEADYMAQNNLLLKRTMPNYSFDKFNISVMIKKEKDNELKSFINEIIKSLEKNGKLNEVIKRNMVKK